MAPPATPHRRDRCPSLIFYNWPAEPRYSTRKRKRSRVFLAPRSPDQALLLERPNLMANICSPRRGYKIHGQQNTLAVPQRRATQKVGELNVTPSRMVVSVPENSPAAPRDLRVTTNPPSLVFLVPSCNPLKVRSACQVNVAPA